MVEIKLFDSLSRSVRVFEPLGNRPVGIYSCGPTVYARQHLGNMRPYVFADLLRRTLSSAGYAVKHVINVTDVGHLTSDADEGADESRARGQPRQHLGTRDYRALHLALSSRPAAFDRARAGGLGQSQRAHSRANLDD